MSLSLINSKNDLSCVTVDVNDLNRYWKYEKTRDQFTYRGIFLDRVLMYISIRVTDILLDETEEENTQEKDKIILKWHLSMPTEHHESDICSSSSMSLNLSSLSHSSIRIQPSPYHTLSCLSSLVKSFKQEESPDTFHTFQVLGKAMWDGHLQLPYVQCFGIREDTNKESDVDFFVKFDACALAEKSSSLEKQLIVKNEIITFV
ncbi:MAG: hypothetical protein Sylvanvirus4_24 [Sylvanvirus sp.]|uniref:Uncharacterized protein n=1 Tax=Sylvanvirus sp. TaxID=2487774 RepID=A0A3G5AHH4_9VIRU|nr:MAG: hypothetical protein Sylvanvirus4_24 [Sylvanvirus sp.]